MGMVLLGSRSTFQVHTVQVYSALEMPLWNHVVLHVPPQKWRWLWLISCISFHQPADGGFRSMKVPESGRRFFPEGNWKCNGSHASVTRRVDELNAADVDVVVCPSFVCIAQVLASLTPRINVAAQNCGTGEGGAFRGETRADQLADAGVQWVVTGHAERRHVVGESNAIKVSYTLSQGLDVIVAVGETLYEREESFTNGILFEQLQAVANQVTDWSKVVIAYEPVWAIGTGRPCSPQQAQEVHAMIRKWVSTDASAGAASAVRIIYGESVSSVNCDELARQADVNGFFVGRAAWDVKESISAITNSVKVKKVK